MTTAIQQDKELSAEFKATIEAFHKTKFDVTLISGRLTITGRAKTKVRSAARDLARVGFTFVEYQQNPYIPGTVSAVLVKF